MRDILCFKEPFDKLGSLNYSPLLLDDFDPNSSCVKKGYMKDDFVNLFVRRPVRRSPIINRGNATKLNILCHFLKIGAKNELELLGYYARWAALRKLLLQFLSIDSGCEKQILSLGAGFDTTFFQLQEEGLAPHLYVELDFKEVSISQTQV